MLLVFKKNKTLLNKSKTAIVTGGSKGIGFRIAQVLAEKKYNLVICSRNLSEANKAKKKLKSYGIHCVAYKTDVANLSQCKSLVKNTIKKFSKVDLLVNNAGIQGPVGKFWLNDLEHWHKTIHVNLLGTVYMTHEVLKHMLKQKTGTIINLSGGGGAYARTTFSAYGCSKTAVLRFTETLALELKGKNIKILALAPGATWTNMTKKIFSAKKYLDKSDINDLKQLKITGGTSFSQLEDAISFFISKQSNNLSGKLVHVNELHKILKKKSKLKPESGLLRRIDYV